MMTRRLLAALAALLLGLSPAAAQTISYGPGPVRPDLSNATLPDALINLGLSVTPESYGALGNGAQDDTAAIQSALNAGKGVVILNPRSNYKVTSSLTCPQNTSGSLPVGIVGPGKLYAPAASFNNTSLDIAQRYGTNAVVVNCGGLTTGLFTPNYVVLLRDFTIESEVSQGRAIIGISVRNAVNPVISGIELYGFPVGRGINAASLVGGEINDNYIHDFTDNATWASSPQITGIEIDNDKINGVVSVGTTINGNRIRDLTLGATPLAAWGFETDGINFVNGKSLVANYNTIYNVGEGIDAFSTHGSFIGNTIDKTYIFGLKLAHGAQYNTVSVNTITRAGLAGVRLESVNADTLATSYNSISGNTISALDPDAVFVANTSAGILVTGAGGKHPSYNSMPDNIITPGNGKYSYVDTSSGAGNVATIQETIGATGRFLVTNSSSSFVRSLRPTNIRVAQVAAAQVVTTSGAVLVLDTELADTRSEWANNTFTVQVAGAYQVAAQARSAAVNNGKSFALGVLVNGSAVNVKTGYSTIGEIIVSNSTTITAAVGDAVTFFLYNGDTGDISLTNNALYTNAQIYGPIGPR